jgi:cell division ATPase FtsA
MSQPEALFALDVGTRKVAGLWVALKDGRAKVLHYAHREHPERAMLDGQVHHIEKAARVVAQVKADLEALIGAPLNDAHVAVAGRSLLTSEHAVSLKTDSRASLSRQQVLSMELQAVKEAKSRLSDPRAAAGTYCVGYSVSKMSLDGQPLGALEGHSGENVEMTVLATFLPKLVLDSLQSVLGLAGLNLASLTLEPIAAASIAVPADLRRLNLAMVDVGAGTSDIALTSDGRVAAFAMVPLAGDEVTERLADAFLLDFNQAEALKKADPESIGHLVTDLFGNKRVLQSGEVWTAAAPALAEWASEVAGRIFEMNAGKAPQAVLLVGGGSQAPNMEMALAEAMSIPTSRVGRRPASLQRDFDALPDGLRSAWATTPLGIALSALEKRGLPFAQFRINEERVQVLNLNQRFTVFDVLVAAGKELSEFYGRPGMALTYELNGQTRVEKGGLGVPAKAFLHGSAAGLDDEIKPGESLVFVPAQHGADGKVTLSEALKREGLNRQDYQLNGEERSLPMDIRINGKLAVGDPELKDLAKVTAGFEASLESLLASEGLDLSGLITRTIAVTVNGEPRVLTQRNYRLAVNGREASLETQVKHSDLVEFEPGVSFQERVRDLLAKPLPRQKIKIKVNGHWDELDASAPRVLMNGREVSADEFLIDGAQIEVKHGEKRVSVVELLAQRPFDQARQKASFFDLRVNGSAAPFSTYLSEGDELEVRFEQAPRPSHAQEKEA